MGWKATRARMRAGNASDCQGAANAATGEEARGRPATACLEYMGRGVTHAGG